MTTDVRPDLRYAWRGPSLLITDTRGEAGEPQRLTGFYFREARYVRTCRLEIDGQRLWLCEATMASTNTLHFSYVHPEVAVYGGGGTGQSGDDEPRDRRGLPQRGLSILLTFRVALNGFDAAARIENRAREPLEFDVSWMVDADFADIQEANEHRRQQQASVTATRDESTLCLRYEHERLPLQAEMHFGGAHSWIVTETGAATHVRLDAGGTTEVPLRVRAVDAPRISEADATAREAHWHAWTDHFTRVRSPANRVFEEMLARNVRDVASLALMEGQSDEWLTLQAGVPMYPALFGRDAITAGWQVGYVDQCAALDAALTRLGQMQSRGTDEWRDAEPGRIPYQVRQGPLARLDINPYSAYYADFASPLMFVISLANLYAWTADRPCLRKHWDAAQRILEWAREYGDRDRDGYLEYLTRSRVGTKNQGWKDSGDAIVYEDGRPVSPPIATCELQGYWYAAQQLMGLLEMMTGSLANARAHWRAAADLKARFNRDWWIHEDAFFALAMDPEKRLVRAKTSNVGHCLACGIIDADHLAPTVGTLFAPDMFSGWGIRTLSADHSYYNPVSYHRGSVWAVEQATILFGLRRFGFDARAIDLATAQYELASLYPQYRIPETVGGYARFEAPSPGAYPQANTPQLWNASAVPLIVQTLLGLLPLASYEVLVVDPLLPVWLPELVVEDLRVGSARVSLRFWRSADGSSEFEVLRKHGTLRIVRQPPPESRSAGVLQRLGGLVDTLEASLWPSH